METYGDPGWNAASVTVVVGAFQRRWAATPFPLPAVFKPPSAGRWAVLEPKFLCETSPPGEYRGNAPADNEQLAGDRTCETIHISR